MTKAKKAIKEANKVADQQILKARLEGLYSNTKAWLKAEAYGYSRGKILLAVIVMIAAVITAS